MVIQTKYGLLRGKKDRGMEAFLGVPYAAPPVGERRYLPPQPPEAWDGIRDAYHYGPRCPQPDMHDTEMFSDGQPDSEDCLYLNIWTPGTDGPLRPVVFHIHGGGSYRGGSRSLYYDGPSFCNGDNIVYVSFNYRLGFFGFLYLGHLLGEKYETSGSLGTMDQIAALQWVKDNIAMFGGDPDNITLMGHSAGAKSVSNIIISPRSKGLFTRAIIQSGSIQCLRSKETSSHLTNMFLKKLGIKPEEAQKILTISPEEIVKASELDRKTNFYIFGPVIDGVNFKKTPQEYLQDGALKDVHVMIGYAKNERGLWPVQSKPLEARLAHIHTRYGDNAPHVEAVFREYLKTMPDYEAWQTLMTEYNYGTASREFSHMLATNGVITWVYRWDHHGDYFPIHGSELAYLFKVSKAKNNKGYPLIYEDFSERMNRCWHAFIKTGNPQIDDLPQWTPYTNATNGLRMYFNLYATTEPFDLNQYDHNFPTSELVLTKEL